MIVSIISLTIGCGHSVTGSNLSARPKNVKVDFDVIGGADFGFQSSAKITLYKEMYKYKDPSECEVEIYEIYSKMKDGFTVFGLSNTVYEGDKIIIEFFPSETHRATLINRHGGSSEIDFDNNIATIYADANFYKEDELYYDIRFEIAGDYAKEPMLIGNTYQITTAEELRWIATKVQNRREDFSGKTIKLMNDIDMENKEFTGIGTYFIGKEFAGIFDGNGFEIQNLNIILDSKYSNMVAFIGGLGRSGVLKNISFTGDIKGRLLDINRGLVSNIYNKANIRELIYNNLGIVQNIYNLGVVDAGAVHTRLIGYNYGTIKNFYNIGITTGSYMIFENGENGTVKNIYYLKETGINEELESIKNNSDQANTVNVLPKTVAEFNSSTGIIFDDPEGVWQFKSGLAPVNGITSRYVLKGIGEGK